MTDKFTKFQVKSTLISGDEATDKAIIVNLPDTKITGYAYPPKLSADYKETTTKSTVKDYNISSKDYGVNLAVTLTNFGEERLPDATLFKYLPDSYSVSDLNFFSADKTLDEVRKATDSLNVEFETLVTSLGSILDVDTKLVITQKYDTYTTTDLLSFLLIKDLENTSIASDVKILSVDTGKLDSITILETVSQRFGKELENTTTSSDRAVLGINPNKLDAVAVIEAVSYSFNKSFSDRVVATDDAFGNLNPDDDQSAGLISPEFDFSGVVDETIFGLNKALAEVARLSDGQKYFEFGKEVVESATPVEFFAKDFSTSYLEISSIRDTVTNLLNKQLADAVTNQDYNSKDINPSKLEVVTTPEVVDKILYKSLVDFIRATDDVLGTINPDDDQSALNSKPAYDFSGVSDLNYRTITKAISETLRVVDDFTLPDDTTRDTYFVSDLLANSLTKAFVESVAYSDETSFKLYPTKLETATINDILTAVVLFFREKTDTALVTSTGIVNKQDYFLEQYETENYAGENFYF